MDQISSMLIMIKNASLAGLPSVTVSYSNVLHAIATCLEKEGYVSVVAKKVRKGHPALEITLSYDGGAKVHEVKRISKPSRRMYMGMRDIRPVRSGRGIIVLSTPKGIMSGNNARKENVGGEPLFTIW